MSLSSLSNKNRKLIQENLPKDLQKIIEEAGFDSESSILLLDSQTIKEIELYANENKHILEGTAYSDFIRNGKVFKFKPGHKATILNLPKLFQNKTKEKKRKAGNENKVESEQILKEKLLKKLVRFAEKLGVQVNFDEENISEFHTEDGKTKCGIACPFCDTKMKCDHRTYWNISNFEKHFKRHLIYEEKEEEQIEVVEILTQNTTQNIIPNPISYCKNKSVELSKIINE